MKMRQALEPALADEHGIAGLIGLPGGTTKRAVPEASVWVTVTLSRRARGEKPPAIATAPSTVMLGTYGYCPGAATSPRMKNGRYASISTATDGSLMKPARSFADISAASPAVVRPRAGTEPISGIVIEPPASIA